MDYQPYRERQVEALVEDKMQEWEAEAEAAPATREPDEAEDETLTQEHG